MSEMFNNYPQPTDYVPNNRPKHHEHKCYTIFAGKTVEHTFEVPFNMVEKCDVYQVIYRLGVTPVIIKNHEQVEIHVEDNKTIVKCVLSPEETSLFANTLLNAEVQLKYFMKDDTVSYSCIYNIKTATALDIGGESPAPVPPGVLGGLGYTED